jgi:hypothetical protein
MYERRGCGEGGGDGQRPGQWGESHEETPLANCYAAVQILFHRRCDYCAAASAL